MNCTDFDAYFDEYCLDEAGDITTATRESMLSHMMLCPLCSNRYARHQQYRGVMSAVKVPNIDHGRAARILRLSVAEGKRKQVKREQSLSFARGFIAASVIAVAFFAGMLVLNHDTSQATSTGLLVGELDWVQDVTIVINVPQDMNSAELVLQLPGDISIQGQEHLSRVSWPVDLKKGANTIVLPVYFDEFAEFSDRLVLSASLIYKNSKKDFELGIDLDPLQKETHRNTGEAVSMLNKIV